jgi:tetratricopeptide (TPR) repeat protein
MLTLALAVQNKYDEALECLRKALDLCPNSAVILTAIGYTLYQKQSYGQAEQCYLKAI